LHLREKLASVFMFSLLLLQVYKFTMVSFEAFNLHLEFPAFMEKLTIFSAILLTFLLFRELLEEEFHLKNATIYTLLTIFFFSNVNILLRFIVPEEYLIEHAGPFNALPLVLIFIVLPVFTFVFERSFKKTLIIVVLAVGVVYPVGQLYPFIIDKFVTLLATFYTIYAVVAGFSRGGFDLKKVLHRTLEFEEIIVERFLLHPAEEAEDKVAFYFYAVILFYVVSDFTLYILPALTGAWVPGEYLEKLGTELPEAHLSPISYASLVVYLLLVFYPFLRDATEIADKPWFATATALSSIIFFIAPSVMLSPLISYNGYGVLMIPWESTLHEHLVLFPILSISSLLAVLILCCEKKRLLLFIYPAISLASLALLIPYLFVYAYSLIETMVIWYLNSPYIVFVGILLLFIILSFVVISKRWISELIETGACFSFTTVLFYVALVLFLTVPSAYSTAFFLIVATAFVLTGKTRREVILKGAFSLYILSLLLVKGYSTLSALLLVTLYATLNLVSHEFRGLWRSFGKVPKKFIGVSIVFIGLFVLIGSTIGEIIPFEQTLPGFLLLFLFSSAEETAMKGVLYRSMEPTMPSKLLVALVFVLTHLLNFTILFTYLHILPAYVMYLFMYQILSLHLYDEVKSISIMSVIHFLVNAGVSLLGM